MSVVLQSKLLPLASAAELAGVSEDTIRRRISDGSLPARKVAGRWKIAADDLQRFIDGEEPESRPRPLAELAPEDPVARFAEEIGVSERVAAVRPDLAGRLEVVAAGEHFGRFCERFLRHHQRVPNGPEPGAPLVLEPFQQEFFDEALAVGEDGTRTFSTAVLLIPRKNRKTTNAAVLSLYLARRRTVSDEPLVVQAAGSRMQAGKLYETTRGVHRDPRYGSELLQVCSCRARRRSSARDRRQDQAGRR